MRISWFSSRGSPKAMGLSGSLKVTVSGLEVYKVKKFSDNMSWKMWSSLRQISDEDCGLPTYYFRWPQCSHHYIGSEARGYGGDKYVSLKILSRKESGLLSHGSWLEANRAEIYCANFVSAWLGLVYILVKYTGHFSEGTFRWVTFKSEDLSKADYPP